SPLFAGAPYDTDDPEPAELHHLEFYLATHSAHEADGWSGTAPQWEVNYGAVKNLQLHFSLPLAYNNPANESSSYGISDAEVGFKYRFIEEGKIMPQVAIYPAVEIPTGNEHKGLGSGQTQFYLPIWL